MAEGSSGIEGFLQPPRTESKLKHPRHELFGSSVGDSCEHLPTALEP